MLSKERDDLALWLEFLRLANQGFLMSLLTIHKPSGMSWSDLCPFGVGGYPLNSELAWRLWIPKDAPFYGVNAANNVLEFLGMCVSVLLLLQESANETFPCLLTLGDNTLALGWMSKSSRLPKSSPYYLAVKFMARHIAKAVSQQGAQLS